MTTAAARSRLLDAQSATGGRLTNFAFAVAPIGVLAGWTVMRLGASRSTGVGWALAHSIWLISYALFGIIVAELYRRIRAQHGGGKVVAVLSAGIAAAGIAAIAGQMIVDLVVGLAASDRAQMHELFQRAFAVPGVHLVLYRFGPMFLIIGLAALFTHLAVIRRAFTLTTVLALVGIVLIGMEGAAGGAVRLLLMPAGVGCLWLALNGVRRTSTLGRAGLSK
ncbi:hypothetical protein [Melissospora conviva]|uniref:hypothetical protein n=1 Tax=Melissospora conviva TaxID=3388432 RepID=UPI003C140754